MTDRDETRAGRGGSHLMVLNGRESGGTAVAEREPEASGELTAADLREARRAFELKLRGKRMHPRWIEENAEELFAKAQQQYAEWLAAGRVARIPRAWLVHTAWCRAIDRIDYEHRRGPSVALEDVSYAIADEKTPTPEDELLAGDRREQLLEAMAELKPEQRELLKLVYFDNLEIKEAGEILGWTSANASYHHKAVLKRLRKMLDGKVELPEIGSAAATFAALDRVDAFSVAKLFEEVTNTATAILDRLGELPRRLLAASDPATAPLAGGAARAAGVCAAAAAAVCLAGGVVGPGVGVVDLIDSEPAPRSTPKAPVGDPRPLLRSAAESTAEEPVRSARARKAVRETTSKARAATEKARAEKSSRRRSSRPPREAGEDQVNAEAVAEPAYTEPVEPRPMQSEESAGSEVEPSGGSSTRGTSPATEFGL